MEGLTSHSAHLRSLQLQSAKLASAGVTLSALLDEEADSLKRKDEVSQLTALRSTIGKSIEWTRSMESAASYGHGKAELEVSLFELGAGLFLKVVTDNRVVQGVANSLLKNKGGKDTPFGTIMIRIGPRGIPDDVAVVRISELARNSDVGEPEVISELERRGYLLFGERAFSLLMDRVTGEVQAGRASLPVPPEKLAQMVTLKRLPLATEQVTWMRVPRPR